MYSCAYWPRNSPLPPHLGSYTRALLVSQNRRHLFVNSWWVVTEGGCTILCMHTAQSKMCLYISLPPPKMGMTNTAKPYVMVNIAKRANFSIMMECTQLPLCVLCGVNMYCKYSCISGWKLYGHWSSIYILYVWYPYYTLLKGTVQRDRSGRN